MEQSEKVIQLVFNRQNFEELYFKDNNSSIFLSSQIKTSFLTLLTLLVLFLFSIVYSLFTNNSAWLIIVLLIFLVLAFYVYYTKAAAIIAWRKNVKEYLDNASKIKTHKLILSQNSLSVVEDGVENITKWSAFTKATIENSHLILFGTDNHIFPRKSMQLEDYEFLCEMVKSRIKHAL